MSRLANAAEAATEGGRSFEMVVPLFRSILPATRRLRGISARKRVSRIVVTDKMQNKEMNTEREMNPEREVKVSKLAKFWTYDLMDVSRPNLRLKKEDELITS